MYGWGRAHPPNVEAGWMTILLILGCWSLVSAVCAPVIGQLLYAAQFSSTSAAQVPHTRTAPLAEAAGHKRSRRRLVGNHWSRRFARQPKAF